MRSPATTPCRRSLVAGLLLLALPLLVHAQALPPPSDEESNFEIDTAPVQIDGRVLFRVRGVSSLQASTRARAIEERIRQVAADHAIPPDALQVIESDGLQRIAAQNRPVMAIAPGDAQLEGVLPRTLAIAHLDRIRRSIVEYRADRSFAVLRGAALRTGAAALAAVLAVLFVVLLRRRVRAKTDAYLQRRVHSVGIQTYEIVGAERIRGVFQGTFRAAYLLMLATIALVFFSFSLRQFPWTRSTSGSLVSMVLGPLETMGRAVVAHVPNLVFLAILFVVFRFVLRLARLFFDAVGRGLITLSSFDPEWSTPTYKIVRLAIVGFAIVVAYPYVPGSDSDAFKGVSLFAGLLFSLGSTSVIANIVAGYMMTYRRAFRLGDRVKIAGLIGDVTELRLQVTRLRSPKNEEIVVPNSQILNGEVVNYSALAHTCGLILHTEVGIGYETPWRQVEAMLLMAADRTAGILHEPAPFVMHKALGDFAINYELNAYCDDPQAMYMLYTRLHRHILDVFNEYGVQIMTPAYEGDPASPKVVPRDLWHTMPAVRSAVQSELT